EVYRNGTVIGDCHVEDWRFCGAGGRVGLMLRGASASRFTEFGGGDVPIRDNEPPVARIVTPLDHSFFVADEGEKVVLRGSATDADDPAESLRYAWSVSLR